MNTRKTPLAIVVFALAGLLARAEVTVPPLFGEHMVLQQKHANPVWGWAAPGETIRVSIAGQEHTTRADDRGSWRVVLTAMPAGGPHRLEVHGAGSALEFGDVLVGEVWICSGQSNMEWTVDRTNEADIDILTARHPRIRLVTVPRVGTQEPQKSFVGKWSVCSPETVKDFSGVGFLYGRILERALEVPIGLIDNAWGGSAAEAWIDRAALARHGRFDALLASWKELEANYDLAAELKAWEAARARWEAEGRQGREPRRPTDQMSGNHRPGNIFNGVLLPTVGYGIRGVIWYQGESNAGRAMQYRDLFPFMIEHWRQVWGQGDFPFYYVQLADYMAESDQPKDSAWAELREAQTKTMARVPKTGQAVIIECGEGRDIHPRNKATVAHRLARWALARDYGFDLECQSPTWQSMEQRDGRVVLTFDHVGTGLYAFDTPEVHGFAVAGNDRKFHWAEARVVDKNRVEVWSEAVPAPVAVRYAWADNPRCNLFSREGLPATPFRTDDWPGVTQGRETR